MSEKLYTTLTKSIFRLKIRKKTNVGPNGVPYPRAYVEKSLYQMSKRKIIN